VFKCTLLLAPLAGAALLTTSGAPPAAAQSASGRTLPVYVDGAMLETDGLLLRDSGRTVLPMRTLFEALGAEVAWDSAQRAVYAWRADGNGLRLAVGDPDAQTLQMPLNPGPGNWGPVTGTYRLEAPALNVGSRVYIPLRFAAEALEADVRFVAHQPAVFINSRAVAGYREEEPAPVPQQPQPPVGPAPVEPAPVAPPVEPAAPPVVVPPAPEPAVPPVFQPVEAPEPPAADPLTELLEALEVSIRIEGFHFHRGERVTMHFTVRNEADYPVVVPFRSGQEFDIEILQEGMVVWNWARDKSFTQALNSKRLRPGEETVYSVRWDQKNNSGKQVTPGHFMVRGIVTTAFQNPQLIAEQRIEIRR
jgi:hypothetical protein